MCRPRAIEHKCRLPRHVVRAQITPSASLRLVKFRLYFETKLCIAPIGAGGDSDEGDRRIEAATWLRNRRCVAQERAYGVQNHKHRRLAFAGLRHREHR